MMTVLRTLLGNAWKYTSHTEQARGALSTPKSATDDAGSASADNGAGFDMAHADRLFQPFIRLHRQDEFVGMASGSPPSTAS